MKDRYSNMPCKCYLLLCTSGHWVNSAAVLAIGGGFDTGYLRALGSEGLQIIKDYVNAGGRYLGICAGAYLACHAIEFDKGGALEVCGQRRLGFFPGIFKTKYFKFIC